MHTKKRPMHTKERPTKVCGVERQKPSGPHREIRCRGWQRVGHEWSTSKGPFANTDGNWPGQPRKDIRPTEYHEVAASKAGNQETWGIVCQAPRRKRQRTNRVKSESWCERQSKQEGRAMQELSSAISSAAGFRRVAMLEVPRVHRPICVHRPMLCSKWPQF